MKLTSYIVLVVVLIGCFQFVQSARVLGYFTSFSKSHVIIHMAVVQTLIDKGHDVTVVTTIPLENVKNFRHILIKAPPLSAEVRKTLTSKPPKNVLENMSRIMNFVPTIMQMSNDTLQDDQIKKLMETETFDLVILGYFFNDFQLGLGAHFKCPIVISWTIQPMKGIGDMVGLPSEPLYVPHLFAGLQQPLGFMSRVMNVFINIIDMIFAEIHNRNHIAYYKSNFPSDKYPSFDEVKKNVSLILSNYHFSHGIIRPLVPAVVEVGGIQIKSKPDPLPTDVQKILDNATPHGAIYFSLGSNVRSAEVEQNKIQAIYKVLSSLKQTVLWKWETDETPGNSSNIFYKKWFSQDDILAHPNIKLFITHGGAGSVVESQYHGVPMVVIPFVGDQMGNANAVESSGFGVTLPFSDLTEEKFKQKINTILENFIYKENVERFSQLYRDRPITAKETAGYWLEYVIRHKGAKHIQSPAVHLNGVQYYGLDVIGSILIVLYVGFKIAAFVFIKVVCRLMSFVNKKNKSSKRAKKE